MALSENDRNAASGQESRWDLIANLLSTAMDLPVSAQNEYLKEACVDDPDLYGEVCSLLMAEHQAGVFLEASTVRSRSAAIDRQGSFLGPWLVEERIGEGATAVVYRARRSTGGVQQYAALKVFSNGPSSKDAERRFRAELRTLAGLDHPNIIRLLDGGVAGNGVPYIAMDLLEGRPIGEFCEAKLLTIFERVRLCIKVARIIHYAHQRLVIHADIKPTNVLVTGNGSPMLLDFGITRILDADSSVVEARQPGCPTNDPLRRYASPELLRGGQITTVSDVYSLGVLFYEMLTGRNWPEARDSGDSARLSDLIPSSARLNAIVAKATQSDPEDRYQSADALALELEAYLNLSIA